MNELVTEELGAKKEERKSEEEGDPSGFEFSEFEADERELHLYLFLLFLLFFTRDAPFLKEDIDGVGNKEKEEGESFEARDLPFATHRKNEDGDDEGEDSVPQDDIGIHRQWSEDRAESAHEADVADDGSENDAEAQGVIASDCRENCDKNLRETDGDGYENESNGNTRDTEFAGDGNERVCKPVRSFAEEEDAEKEEGNCKEEIHILS